MLTLLLESAGNQPSYMIGSGEIKGLEYPGKWDTKGDVFVAISVWFVERMDKANSKFCLLKKRRGFGHREPDVERSLAAAWKEAVAGSRPSKIDLICWRQEMILLTWMSTNGINSQRMWKDQQFFWIQKFVEERNVAKKWHKTI